MTVRKKAEELTMPSSDGTIEIPAWVQVITKPTDADHVRNLLTARMDEVQRAINLAHEDSVRIPTEVQKQIGSLRELLTSVIAGNDSVYMEKFSSINTMFVERDKRTEKMEVATATAVSAALQAAKELSAEQGKAFAQSIAKSEAATSKQLEQLTVMQQAGNKTSDDKTNDLKERQGIFERQMAERLAQSDRQWIERLSQIEGQRKGGSDSWGAIGLIAGLVIAVATIVVSVMVHK
jgi:uncharacterized phage infection (PIP) family protein YhgE